MSKYICTNCKKEKNTNYWINCTFCDTKCCHNCIDKIWCECIECEKCVGKRCTRCSTTICYNCKNKRINNEKEKLECDICKNLGCQLCISSVCCDCCYNMCYNCKNDDNIKCGCYGSCESCGCDVDRCDTGWPCSKCNKWLCNICKCKCNDEDD